MLHEIENNVDTELFLKQNGKKFSQDCITAMKLMYQGVWLSGETCKQLYNIHDRRLRECYSARPDIVQKKWVFGQDGKRKYVVYWIDQINPPTKTEVVEKALRYVKGEKAVGDYARALIDAAKSHTLAQSKLNL